MAKIREEEGSLLVHLDTQNVLPLRLAYQDARFRIRLRKEYIDSAALPVADIFRYYLSLRFNLAEIKLVDSLGDPIPFQFINPPHTITFSSEEKVEYNAPVILLEEWFHSQGMDHKDHILVTIKDWERGIFQLDREQYGDQ